MIKITAKTGAFRNMHHLFFKQNKKINHYRNDAPLQSSYLPLQMGSTLDSRFQSSALHPAVWVQSTVMMKDDLYSSKSVLSLNYVLNLFHISLCLSMKHFSKNPQSKV